MFMVAVVMFVSASYTILVCGEVVNLPHLYLSTENTHTHIFIAIL